MNIRWRLSVVAIQLGILLIATSLAIGTPYTGATWFTAGLLSVVISSQILEPFYPRPADVIGNTLICLLLYATTARTIARPAWTAFLILIILLLVLSVFSSLFGTGKAKGKWTTFARVAKNISTEATAARIYSIVFWLSLIESYPRLEKPFWIMGVAWAILVILGLMDWQRLWETLAGKTKECSIEGTIAPSRVIVSATEFPNPGSWIALRTKEFNTKGVVISRIQRIEDVWGQVYLENQEDCEKLLKSRIASYEIFSQTAEDVLGIADEGSSQENLVFQSNRPLEIGNVVLVESGKTEILYQIYSARILKLDIKGGALLQAQASAKQLGIFDTDTIRMKRHSWIPNPGAAVSISNLDPTIDKSKIPASWVLIGHIVGTDIPIYLDAKLASEGHLAILGMTKMGKTSLAVRIMNALAKDRVVTVLDQTGEYISKRGIKPYNQNHDSASNGIAVLEPLRTENAITKALGYLQQVMNLARTEYEKGNPKSRSILFEEAHQFIPEPSGLSYGTDKDNTQKIGSLMMQVRKYGISIVLISQRTAVVAKSALSQCENIIAFRSVDRTGLDYLDTIAGRDTSDMLPSLKQGQALVFGPAFSCDSPVVVQILQETAKSNFVEISPPMDSPANLSAEDDIPF
jgi:hypothetical protein